MKKIPTPHPFSGKHIVLYNKEDAQAQADKWRRYTKDFYIRYIKKTIDRIEQWSIFNEGFPTFITGVCWLGATLMLITFHVHILK